MKNRLVILISVLFIFSCSQNKNELYKITDSFVESLDTKLESYGIQGEKYSKLTIDEKYKVTPFGRLINVKIMEVVEEGIYEELRDDLTDHYDNDERVNKVYINKGGTVMIDCRN